MLLKMIEFVSPFGTELLFVRVPAGGDGLLVPANGLIIKNLMKGPDQPQQRVGGRPRSREGGGAGGKE